MAATKELRQRAEELVGEIIADTHTYRAPEQLPGQTDIDYRTNLILQEVKNNAQSHANHIENSAKALEYAQAHESTIAIEDEQEFAKEYEEQYERPVQYFDEFTRSTDDPLIDLAKTAIAKDIEEIYFDLAMNDDIPPAVEPISRGTVAQADYDCAMSELERAYRDYTVEREKNIVLERKLALIERAYLNKIYEDA